jgi:hypothetical protein
MLIISIIIIKYIIIHIPILYHDENWILSYKEILARINKYTTILNRMNKQL